MREIKFRAWQKHHRKMLPVKIIDFNRNTITVDYGEKTIPRFNTFDMENFELMQYTGLKDKNGTEIYEGDIVKAKDPYKLNSKERFYTCEVVFTDGALFMLKHKTVKWGKEEVHYYNMRIMEIEVIGNIHDNPELLGGAK